MSSHIQDVGNIINNVLTGDKNQLFLHEGNYNQFSFLSGEDKVSGESKNNFLSNLKHRQNFARQRNIDFLHVIFPCKPLVLRHACPEPYRSNIRSLFLHSYSHLFSCRDYEAEHVLYPLAALIHEQTDQDCYWSNDTHINAVGQLCIYREIAKSIKGMSRDFPLFRIQEQLRQGDLGLMLGKQNPMPSLCFPWLGETLQFSNTNELPGNTGDVVITHNPLSKSERRLVLFGDSFIKTILHLFAQDFRTVLYIRGPYFQPDMINLFEPDVLITSETERYLAGVDSDNNGSSLLFSSIQSSTKYQPTKAFEEAFSAQLSHRSHPRITAQWEADQERQHRFHIEGIGDALHNCELKQLAPAQEGFEAIGPVPVIYIHKLSTEPHGELVVSMHSNVNSRLKITVLRNCTEMASPLEIHEHEVTQGIQQMHFKIDHTQAIDGLLFQPLHHVGTFQLLKFSWQSSAIDETD